MSESERLDYFARLWIINKRLEELQKTLATMCKPATATKKKVAHKKGCAA